MVLRSRVGTSTLWPEAASPGRERNHYRFVFCCPAHLALRLNRLSSASEFGVEVQPLLSDSMLSSHGIYYCQGSGVISTGEESLGPLRRRRRIFLLGVIVSSCRPNSGT